MAFKTVANLKDGVSGLLTGTNLDNVTNINGAIERGARTLLQRADVPEASGRQSVIVYDGVYDYAAPTTIFGAAVIDFRPQGATRTTLDEPYKSPIVQFDQEKAVLPNGVMLAFEYKNGTPIMRVASARVTSRVVLDTMDSTSGWVAAGSGSGLTADTTIFYSGSASLRFICTGASTATLTKTIGTQSMTDYQSVGVVFLAIYTPDATDLTSIVLRLGSSSSAYTSVTATTGFLGAWTINQWTLVAFDLSTGTDTGTPNYAAISYVQLRVAHAATITNLRVGGIWCSLPSPQEIIFQSAAIFLASGGSPTTTITADNDSVILNDAAYTLLEYECAKSVALQMSGGKYTTLIQGFDLMLDGKGTTLGLYDHYRADNPSEELRNVGSYYD